MCRQNHPRRAVAALEAVRLAKCVLHHAQFARGGSQSLDGRDVVPVRLNRKHQAGPRRLSVDKDGTCAAYAMFATCVTADQEEVLAQRVEERLARLHIRLSQRAVHPDADSHRTPPIALRASAKALSRARCPKTAATR